MGERGLLLRKIVEVYTMTVQQHWMASMDYHDLQKCLSSCYLIVPTLPVQLYKQGEISD
jgi:hypothetical protein